MVEIPLTSRPLASLAFGVLELHAQGFLANHLTVECCNSLTCLMPFHFNEAKSLALTTENIGRQFDRPYTAEFRKEFCNAFFCRFDWQAANKHFFH